MATSQRLSATVGVITRTASSPYICASCRTRAAASSHASAQSRQQLRHSSDIPFTEKIRRKIWGTDNPPGLKDPYGGPSFLERRLAQRKQAQQSAGQELSQETSQEVQSQLDAAHEDQPTVRSSPRNNSAPDSWVVDRSDAEPLKPSRGTYEPAISWEGLDWVGDKGEYQFQEENEVDAYVPWLTPSSSDRLSEVEIWDAIHESIFDVVQPEGEEYDREVAIHVTSAGHVAGPGEGPVGGADAFMNAKISFKDPEAKTFKASFVILKNFQQVTGLRLSDPTLNQLAQIPNATFRDLVEIIMELQKPKPQKTHENLMANEELIAQPNVRISERKISPIDREREIGRWKVIEKELMERGLPVVGRAYAKDERMRR
ncbi:uncharacterized protein HMPREF1541_01194 [Cyphellophora europaea CBS 101466]|uniref:Large ribosomal subunit protein mL50 n=1 Tax=Cyphellophora europaea (strain CBS 101466) TaxID=1220924 RepID=W2SGK1_CYPE1|nr:uncharacterized protein HMPREF1541_01194 [Cyphellophora europaea CBS 101466]ETN47004.1 hypothetical protein HMPREF1541_01194 [Cyphellophora europaea CBS 101466]